MSAVPLRRVQCPDCNGRGWIKDPRVQCSGRVKASTYRRAGRCEKPAVYGGRCGHHQERS